MGQQDRLPILTFTTLYPNRETPTHGVFVENRLRHLVASGRVEARVVAPVPWFPIRNAKLFGKYGCWAAVPAQEERHGIALTHPRYVVIPKVGMHLAPDLLFRGVRGHVASLLGGASPPRLIDAHYFYPDGVAAAMLGEHFGLPVVITARGSDINVIGRIPRSRRRILEAAGRAAGIITVSAALREALVELGADEGKIRVLRNGVDLETFRPPADREALRARWRLERPTLLAVGNLIELKGHDLLVRAMPSLPDCELLIAGAGPERAALERRIAELCLGDRVRLLGRLPHAELPDLYGAADVLVHPSSREGWPNVLLEALACGTAVLGTAVGGIPEVVGGSGSGALIGERSVEGIVDAVRAFLADPPARAAARRHAEDFSWEATTGGQIELFESVVG